ncbi:MAG: hypothetical protein AB1726_14635 [Planctomycetota bacterium]
MRARFPVLRQRFALFQNLVTKAAARGARAEAVWTYFRVTLEPLVELLRMRHCPERFDYGLRYLDRDLPPEVRAEAEALAFPPSIDRIEASRARAAELFAETVRAWEAGEWGADLAPPPE